MQISRPVGSYCSASVRDNTTSSGARAGAVRCSSPPRRLTLRRLRGPGANELTDGNYLCQVIGRVIDCYQHRAQIGLPRSMRNFRRQIYVTVGCESFQRHTVLPPAGDRLIPRLLAGRGSAGGPIVLRPAELFLVGGILDEVEQIVLGDANVLDELPDRMGKSRWALSAQLGSESLQCAF